MSDFPRVTPGQKFRPSAEAWNAALDAASDVRANRFGGDAGDAVDGGISPVIVTVKNVSGGTLDRFAVAKFSDFLITPTESATQFKERVAFDVTTPGSTTDYVCVLLEPIRSNTIGRAVISGAVQVQINVTNTGHKYATPTASDATKLTSAAAATQGAVEILAKESGTGTKWAIVRLGTLVAPSGGGGSLTVQDDSGTPSYTSITTLEVVAAGAISNPSAGVARILDATSTTGGLVNDTTQSFKGIKTFVTGAIDLLAPTTNRTRLQATDNGTLGGNLTVTCNDSSGGFGTEDEAYLILTRPANAAGHAYITLEGTVGGTIDNAPAYKVTSRYSGVTTTYTGAWAGYIGNASVDGLNFAGGLFVGGNVTSNTIAYTTTAADPTTTEIAAGKVGIHKNSSSGDVFFAYNDSGTIKKVQLT